MGDHLDRGVGSDRVEQGKVRVADWQKYTMLVETY